MDHDFVLQRAIAALQPQRDHVAHCQAGGGVDGQAVGAAWDWHAGIHQRQPRVCQLLTLSGDQGA